MVAAVDHKRLRDAALFRDLPEDVLRDLATHCRYMELHAGETLFYQGDPGDALYVLLDGQIHIVRSYPNGDEVVLATEGPFYVIGELSMLANQPRTGGVVAVADCTLIALDRASFVDVCERVPGVASTVLSYISQRFYRMNLLVRETAIGNIEARVASVLLLLSGDEAGEISSDVRVNRVARAVAIDADAVERILSQWDNEGVVDFDGQRIVVHDVKTLHNIAG